MSQYLVNIYFFGVKYTIVFFQPGVDPALPQAFPAAGGSGARRRGYALQEGVQEE